MEYTNKPLLHHKNNVTIQDVLLGHKLYLEDQNKILHMVFEYKEKYILVLLKELNMVYKHS
jgi:hypothetical protein